jgi:hypothetical protein
MNIDNYPVELIFVKNDEIWNHQFDNNYIASWGGFPPENEIKGMISPVIFPGLPEFWSRTSYTCCKLNDFIIAKIVKAGEFFRLFLTLLVIN